MNPAVVMQNVITKESVAVMVAVPVTMDGTSNLIVQVILVSIETYLLHIILKKSPPKEFYCIVLFSEIQGILTYHDFWVNEAIIKCLGHEFQGHFM